MLQSLVALGMSCGSGKTSKRTRSLLSRRHLALFFFFQAEDGIRDYKVTGVQTCALPILRKGWLPMATTRGDRLFIGLLLAAYVNLAWVGLGERMAQWFSLEAEPSVWISLVLSMLVLAVVMRKG